MQHDGRLLGSILLDSPTRRRRMGYHCTIISCLVRNLRQLEAALHEEWGQLPLERFRRLVRGMRRRLDAVVRVHGGSTRYGFTLTLQALFDLAGCHCL